MADVKISQLPAATTPVAGTEVLPIVQSGTTSQVSINAATGITRPFTSGGVMYASSTSALATGSALTFDGTNFATTGTATATKLIPTGTSVTGNGMYLPNTNSIGISTAGVNAFYIDASQNVGIGTSSPSSYGKFSVYGASSNGTATFLHPGTASFGTVVTLETYAGTDSPALSFKNYNSGSPVYYSISENSSGALLFNSSGGVSSAGTERMRINSSGNVGIGTSSPASKFNVSGSFNAAGTASYPAILSGGGYGGGFGMQDGTGVSGIYVQSSGTEIVFFTGQTSADSAASKALMYLNTGLGIGGAPNASAILDAQSTTKGVRMPNMTTTQKNAISSPAAGLMVFDTTLAKLCVYSGSAWQTITSV